MIQNLAAQLQQQLAHQTGLSLDLLQRPNIAGFVKRRCQELGLLDELAYYRLAIADPLETERLVKEISVPETWFFRYPASFELLVDHCSRLLRGGQQGLRMLSIACATGEEPYGMTMAALQGDWPIDRIAVDALDRGEASLAIARRALYRNISFREPMPPWAERWLRNVDGATQVDANVVARVRFLCGDILNRAWTDGQSTYDIVFCRNLFIYLSDPARAKLSRVLSSLLSPDGLLFVGHAETAILAGESFRPVGVKHTFALARKSLGQESLTRESLTRESLTRKSLGQEQLGRKQLARKHSTPVAQPSPLVVENPRSPSARQPTRHTNNPISPSPKSIDPSRAESKTRQDPTLEDAAALADAGRLEEAMAVLDVIEQSHLSQPAFFELLGNIQLSLGQIQEAREAFTKVVYFKPDHEVALLQLAIIFDRLGNAEQASRFRRRAMHAHDREQRQSAEHTE